jgi:hypothetical protein
MNTRVYIQFLHVQSCLDGSTAPSRPRSPIFCHPSRAMAPSRRRAYAGRPSCRYVHLRGFSWPLDAMYRASWASWSLGWSQCRFSPISPRRLPPRSPWLSTLLLQDRVVSYTSAGFAAIHEQSFCRSRPLHPCWGLRDVRHFLRLLRDRAPAPRGDGVVKEQVIAQHHGACAGLYDASSR